MALAVPGSPQRRASIFKRGVTTTLHGPNDLSTEIALGQRETLAEEVKEACRKLGVQSDGPLEESFLFTVGSGAAANPGRSCPDIWRKARSTSEKFRKWPPVW